MRELSHGFPIDVLLIDDHALFRQGVQALLRPHGAVRVVGQAADAGSGARLAEQLRPAVILLDMHMPGMTGVQALQLLRRASPRSAILVVTMSEQACDLAQALEAGASGYLLKTIDSASLLGAIARAAAGEQVIADSMRAKLAADDGYASAAAALASLTGREREVLDWIARGVSNKVIARELVLAESTVKIHVQNVLRKLGMGSRVQAALFAVEQRLGAPAPRS